MEINNIIEKASLKLPKPPEFGFVLGSGVDVFNGIDTIASYNFVDLFGIKPSVSGHSGSLTFGLAPGSEILIAVLKGRYHVYEGHSLDVVTLPLQLLKALGLKNIVLTNAAGGIDQSFTPSDLMVITSYFDCISPNSHGVLDILKAPPEPYSSQLLDLALKLSATDKTMQKGCYAAVLGPSYETTAEVNMLKVQGANAVGMSTVPELKFALANNIVPLAISVITNVWGGKTEMGGHKEVLEVSKIASKKLESFLCQLIEEYSRLVV